MKSRTFWLLFGAGLFVAGVGSAAETQTGLGTQESPVTYAGLGGNPYPVHLVRPPSATLSAMAQLGCEIFYDKSLSCPGRCHARPVTAPTTTTARLTTAR
jgi:cytochrome c peroxidase